MSPKIIPDTDNVEVAKIAAALHLVESTQPEQEDFESKLGRFRQAYELLSGLTGAAAEEVFVTLPMPPAEQPERPEKPLPTLPDIWFEWGN